MADRISEARRSWNMSRIRGKDTGPELHLRSLLHQAGFRFRLHDRNLPGCPDIVLRKFRTVIFVHGCYWHRHPLCPNATTPSTRREFWQAKFDETVERDKRNKKELATRGWRVLTVWECDLEKNPQAVLAYVGCELKGET